MTLKNCPRCKNELVCKANDIASCACSSIQLSENTKEFLAKTSYDCLCLNCLTELNSTIDQINKSREHCDLVKDKHYYMENGFIVFTERYHMERGSCCKSNCRHCAYGFQAKAD